MRLSFYVLSSSTISRIPLPFCTTLCPINFSISYGTCLAHLLHQIARSCRTAGQQYYCAVRERIELRVVKHSDITSLCYVDGSFVDWHMSSVGGQLFSIERTKHAADSSIRSASQWLVNDQHQFLRHQENLTDYTCHVGTSVSKAGVR